MELPLNYHVSGLNRLSEQFTSLKMQFLSLKQCLEVWIGGSWAFMMMMLNYFCAMVDWQKAFSLISSRDHCQRSSPLRISDSPQARFEPAQNLSLSLVEWSCTIVITTKPWHHCIKTLLLTWNIVSYFETTSLNFGCVCHCLDSMICFFETIFLSFAPFCETSYIYKFPANRKIL